MPAVAVNILQCIVGFLDLQTRLQDVVSVLELGVGWLEPNRLDLTYSSGQRLLINQTEVRYEYILHNL